MEFYNGNSQHVYYEWGSTHYSRRRRRRFFRRLTRLIILLCVIVGGYFLVNTARTLMGSEGGDAQAEIISPLAEPFVRSVQGIQSFVSGSKLEEVVEKSLEGTTGNYSVVVKNLKTGESYARNEHTEYDAASLYKLWVHATVEQQISEGKIKDDQILEASIESLNSRFFISTESAELTEGAIKLTIADAVDQMITISHNYAALLLTSKVRLASVQLFLDEKGLNESKLGTRTDLPKTTAYDIARFYEILYKGEIVNTVVSQKMLGVLKQQELNDRIPKLLPEEIQIAHKTGELGRVKHDAGIVFTPFGDYIIVMLSESGSPKGAAEREAELSKAVYDYFENR